MACLLAMQREAVESAQMQVSDLLRNHTLKTDGDTHGVVLQHLKAVRHDVHNVLVPQHSSSSTLAVLDMFKNTAKALRTSAGPQLQDAVTLFEVYFFLNFLTLHMCPLSCLPCGYWHPLFGL